MCVCGVGWGGGGRGERTGAGWAVFELSLVFLIASTQSTECTNSSVVPRTAGSVGQRLKYVQTSYNLSLRFDL